MKPARQGTRVTRATRWFLRLVGRQPSPQADRRFIQWLHEDPDHAAQYAERELLWHLAGELAQRPAMRTLQADLDAARRVAAPPRWRRRRVLLGAALLATAAALATVGWMLRPERVEYATGVGELRAVELPDRSRIQLNTATRLTVRYARGLRRIDLHAGEAGFTVEKDAARPFEVHADGAVARAVGTQFVVHREASRVDVSVLEGVVDVRGGAGDARRVPAGEGVRVLGDGSVSGPVPADANRIRGWMTGRIVLRSLSLEAALREYNRYTTTPLRLDGVPVAGDRLVSGIFRVGDQRAFEAALSQQFGLVATPAADGGVVLAPAR